jgi:transposase
VLLHVHIRDGYYCPACDDLHYAELPAAVKKDGLVGPRLSALFAFLEGGCHASYSVIQSFSADVLAAELSRGMLAKVVKKTTRALDSAYDELLERLPSEPTVNVDETGHKERRKKFWTWCFRAGLYTLFRISKSRGSKVLVELLGKEFKGVIGCDCFSAYRKFMKQSSVLVEFCLAHLIRDVRFLTTLPDPSTRNYGKRVLNELRRLFHVIHERETMEPALFQASLEKARKEILKVILRAPERGEAQNIADRFREYGKAYFVFITTPQVEPTNNIAERAIRAVVIDRKVTQGTRGVEGRRWCERIWTAMTTCAQQGRSAYEFLHQSIAAHFQGRATPSLLSDTS